jgi:WD40 repeat protein
MIKILLIKIILRLKVWDLESNQLKHTLIGHVNTIECILNLAGTSLISCAAYPERAIRIWDLESGKCINSVTDIHNGGVFSLCLLNNDTLLSGGGYGSIKFTNLNTKTRVKLLKGHTSKIVNMKILNENILISGSEDKIIKTWSIPDEQVLNEIKFGDYFHRVIQISASKMMLLTTSDDVNIKIWSISTGECVNQLEGHSNLILTIKLINDNILASGSWDTTIKV